MTSCREQLPTTAQKTGTTSHSEEILIHAFHGTGDIFSSVFSGACALGKDIQQCLDISVKFTLDCIEATIPNMEETWYGSCFELCLGKLIDYVKEQ